MIGADGETRRVLKKEVLGTLRDLPTRKLARRRLDLLLARINAPGYRPGKVVTFAEFVDLWRIRVLNLQKPSTAKAAESNLRTHLVKHFGAVKLEAISQERVQVFVSGMSAQLAQHTVSNIVGVLLSILKWARSWDYIVGEVKRSELCFASASPRREPRFFTAEQVRAIIAAAKEPWRTLFLVAAMTGLRAGELLGLRVEDLDLVRRTIAVRQSAWYGRIQAPKTKRSVRTIPMPELLSRALVRYLQTWQPNSQRLLFATCNGRPHTSNGIVERRLWPILDELKITRCGLHAFRHTASTLLISEGAPATVAMAQLGHSDPSITLGVYSHVVDAQQRQFVERLAQLVMPDDATMKMQTEKIQ